MHAYIPVNSFLVLVSIHRPEDSVVTLARLVCGPDSTCFNDERLLASLGIPFDPETDTVTTSIIEESMMVPVFLVPECLGENRFY